MPQSSNTDGNAPDLHDYVRAARCIDSVTHNVNNHLGAIMAYAELMELEDHDPSETKRMLDDIVACVQKSAELLDGLAEPIGRQQTKVSDVDLCELVHRMKDIHSHELDNANISLDIECRGDCSPIRAVRGRLSRALMLILRETIDRVCSARPKSIRIRIQGEEDGISLLFWDSSGVPPELENRPKPGDGEDALGRTSLASAQAHARFHGGDLSYDSERGLLLRLPRSGPAPPALN